LCWRLWGLPAVSALSFSANGSERAMLDLILGAVVTVGLLVYLVAALLRPERF
jgi:K+-transporting ATPase KdpF subunit